MLGARRAGGAGGRRSASGMSSPLSSKSKASPSSSSVKGTLSANTGKNRRGSERSSAGINLSPREYQIETFRYEMIKMFQLVNPVLYDSSSNYPFNIYG